MSIDQERKGRLTALDASIARGLTDARTGQTTPAAAVFNRLEGKYRAQSKKVDSGSSPE